MKSPLVLGMDKKLFVIDNKLRLVTTIEDIEKKLEWTKIVMERTNSAIDEYNHEIAIHETQSLDETLERVTGHKPSIESVSDLKKRMEKL